MRSLLFGFVFFVALYFSEAATKEDLLKKAEDLESRAKNEIQKLTDEGKEMIVHELERESRLIANLATDIRNAHPIGVLGENRLRSLEISLLLAESRLEAELKRLEESTPTVVAKRDLQTDLLAKAAQLLTKSNGVIALLESQGKPLLAAGVKSAEKVIMEIEVHLQALHPTSEFGKLALTTLEGLLKTAESKLEIELKKIESAF